MEEKDSWDNILEVAERGYDFSIKSILLRAWEIYKQQPFAFGGFTITIFCILLLSLLLGQLGQMLANIILLPCLLIGYATFTKALISGGGKEASKEFFAGFRMMLSLGLVGMSINLLLTAALAPSIIIFNQLGLDEMIKTFQETQDPSVIKLELSLTQQIVVFLNILFALYFLVAFLWASLLTFFKKLPFYKAIEGSRRLISRKWWKFFGLLLSLSLIYIIAFFAMSLLSSLLGPVFAFFGGIGTVLGLLIVIPMVFISIFLVFDDTLNEISDPQS